MSNVAAALKGQGVQKMSFQERAQAESELREIEDQLSKAKDPGAGTAATPDILKNKFALQAKKKTLEERLNKDDDLVARDSGDKDRLLARKKELELVIKKELPTNRQVGMTQRLNGGDYEKAVNQTVYHQKHHLKDIQEWQEICRRLEPENPDAGDTSKLYR